MVDRQEIRIHWFHILATGFCEHRLQRRKSLFVSFKCKQLSVVEIKQTNLQIGKMSDQCMDRGADLSFVPQQSTEVSSLVSRCCRRINEVSVRFVNILCQHGRWETGRLVLEDDFSRVISFLLVKSDLRIEKKKVWYEFILNEPFPVGLPLKTIRKPGVYYRTGFPLDQKLQILLT
jgi:hypothetical protein